MTNPLLELQRLGQSPWHDNIRRSLLTGGALKKMVDDGDITGLTSNPTIFEQAIAHSNDYDRALRVLARKGKTAEQIFDSLAIEDIREAADVFRSVYDRTKGKDGYVSIEVSPRYAHDTNKTLSEARRLWKAVNRPNLMVKIPATRAGLPAIEQAIATGINVNVTLIFSLERYAEVMTAHMNGLRRRQAARQSVAGIASVASFFVSRVDTLIDKMLDDKITANPSLASTLNPLKGRAAIANAKLAYELFSKRYYGEEFDELVAAGAQVQRPLWASTSTKNPNYRDVLYVETLIGPDTVNTMPPATIAAFKDHGVARTTIVEGYDEARDLFDKLAEVGVDMMMATQKLEDDGVASFFKSFESLLEVIDTRREAELALSRATFHYSNYALDIEAAWAAAESTNLVARLWQQDSTLWKEDDAAHQAEIKSRLGWLTLADDMRAHLADLSSFVKEIKEAGFTHALLLGMGGSSLCPEVLRNSFGVAKGGLDVQVLDSTNVAAVRSAAAHGKLSKTLFIVSSKSGGTVEVMSFFNYFYEQVRGAKSDTAGENFIAITDPGTSLEKLATEKSFRRIFINPPDIGGRYSALSLFGLVPAALMGIDLTRLLDRAKSMARASAAMVPAARNTAVATGVALGLLAKDGRDKVTFLLSKPIESFGDWAEQLIAESTGKEGKGIVPVVGEAPGHPSAYGNDRVFVYLRLDRKLDKTVETLIKAGHPVIRFDLTGVYDLGGEFLRWEIITAAASWALAINPFDQPNVQESKTNTSELLAVRTLWPVAEPNVPVNRRDLEICLRTHLQSVELGDYLALTAFLMRSPKTVGLLQAMRIAVRDSKMVATTVGYGPRYLHSTGQLHKGGADNGVFIQLVADTRKDLSIPDVPYTFATLEGAQALGDFQALKSRGRRVLRIELTDNPESDLAKLSRLFARISRASAKTKAAAKTGRPKRKPARPTKKNAATLARKTAIKAKRVTRKEKK